jgi:DNA repair protein SbcC/Rad50
VRLNSLHLVNFRQHTDSRIAFESGLTGIIGPNGSGKTTILEAITWALYGHARGTRDSIRHSRAPVRASVRVDLDFELGGHRYRVERGLTNAELFLDGASTPIANTITGVTQLLQRRLGMTRAEFFHTYFTGQKELGLMASMGPADRARFLSRVLGYERLRVAQELARERRKAIVAEVAGMRSGMSDRETVARNVALAESRLSEARDRSAQATAGHERARAALATIAPEWERAQRERERWTELSTKIRLAEGQAEQLQKNLSRIARDLDEVRAQRAELDALRAQLTGYRGLVLEVQQLDVASRDEGRRKALAEQERVLADELTQLTERVDRLERAPQTALEVERELVSAQAALADAQAKADARQNEWVREQQEAKTQLQSLLAQRRDVRRQQEQLVTVGEHGECPTCGQSLGGGHYRKVLDELERQGAEIAVNGKYYQDRQKQLAERPADLIVMDASRAKLSTQVAMLDRKLVRVQAEVKELDGLTRELAERKARRAAMRAEIAKLPVGYDEARHALARAEVERLAPLDQRAARVSGAVERTPVLEHDKAQFETQLAAARVTIADLVQERERQAFDMTWHATVREQFERADAVARAAELEVVRTGADADAARKALEAAETARREWEKVQSRLESLVVDRRLHDEVDRAYTDLRDDLNEQLRPEVSELASGFLTELTGGRYTEIELDEEYNIQVLEDGVPKPVISGGEEDIANLVLRLSVSQMIADRAGQAFSLLVLDEVFGSLDDSRRHNVVELLRRLHDRFDQVIVITHIDSVREGLDRVIPVRYDEARGASVVDRPPGVTEVPEARELGSAELIPTDLVEPRMSAASTRGGAAPIT